MNNSNLNHFFEAMWKDYCALNPQALAVYDSLSSYGEKVVNDHIAFRTFEHPKIGVDILSQHFLKHGYKQAAEYQFPEKNLTAKHFQHPSDEMPKVFISQYGLKKASPFLLDVVNKMTAEINDSELKKEEVMYGGRLWPASYETYKKLATESEYAAWVYAHGFRPNHFTVYINYLSKLKNIADLNAFLKSKGFTLNSFGGEIKGSPKEYLEQSSTMANEIPVHFNDGMHKIPACYYEFAKRYPTQDGKLFQGFVGTSANKIFESTNKM